MKTSSCKAKGRRLQQLVAKKISDMLDIPWGPDELIRSRSMGQSGVDVPVIGLAKELFPYSVEAKNQENWSVHSWIKQAKENCLEGTDWLVVAKRNRQDPVVFMDLDVFFKLYEELLKLRKEVGDAERDRGTERTSRTRDESSKTSNIQSEQGDNKMSPVEEGDG